MRSVGSEMDVNQHAQGAHILHRSADMRSRTTRRCHCTHFGDCLEHICNNIHDVPTCDSCGNYSFLHDRRVDGNGNYVTQPLHQPTCSTWAQPRQGNAVQAQRRAAAQARRSRRPAAGQEELREDGGFRGQCDCGETDNLGGHEQRGNVCSGTVESLADHVSSNRAHDTLDDGQDRDSGRGGRADELIDDASIDARRGARPACGRPRRQRPGSEARGRARARTPAPAARPRRRGARRRRSGTRAHARHPRPGRARLQLVRRRAVHGLRPRGHTPPSSAGHAGMGRSIVWEARRVGGVRRSWARPQGICRIIRLPLPPPRQTHARSWAAEYFVDDTRGPTLDDGQWEDSHLRVGEAQNPGPSSNQDNRARWGAFEAQDPAAAGFRHALAPGFGAEAQGEDGEMGLYALRVITVNVTSWGSVLGLLATTRADILLVQEHKLGEERAEEAAAWLRRRGWNAMFSPALHGANGGWSAGVAVLARSHIGISLPPSGTEHIEPGRAVAARIEAPGCRPFVAMSIYLHDGKGLARCNLDLLGKAGTFLAAQGEHCPFIVGGDFQVPPEDIATVGLANELKAALVASRHARGTCRTARSAREIDYFYVSTGMTDGIDTVTAVQGTGIKTHVPIELAFKPCLTSIRALVIRKPPAISTERIIGPLREVTTWDDLQENVERLARDAMDMNITVDDLQCRLGDAFTDWADRAEAELLECAVDGHKVTCRHLRGRKPVLVWRSILKERPAKEEDSDNAQWRSLANCALELQRLSFDVRARQRQHHAPHHSRPDHHEPGADALGDADDLRDDDERLAAQLEDAADETQDLMRRFAQRSDDGGWEDAQDGARLARRVTHAIRCLREGVLVDQDYATEIKEIRAEIGVRVDAIADQVKARHVDAWTRWIRTGIDAGARNAHRFTRLPPQWRPQPLVAPDGILSADPGKTIEAYREKYARRWNADAERGDVDRPRTAAPWQSAPRCHLPRPSIEELRESAKAFPHDTAVSYDGLAMRHYAMVSDAALAALSHIVVAMEAIARLPPQLEALVMPLLGKERGGHRAITTAPSLYRLWGRLRRTESQNWEAAHDRAYFAAGKGRRLHDVLWRQAARAEAGDGEGLASGAVLWDMSSYYDTINRTRLWRMTVKHGFPMAIARLAFAMYEAPRVLSLEGRLSCPTYARDGVPAGCPFANAFTRVYSIDPFDAYVESEPMKSSDDAVFDSYIDDLVASATGQEDTIVSTVVELAVALRDIIENEMGCELELSKAAVVASSPSIARRIASRLGAYGGSGGGVASAVNLGVDYAPGRRRTAHRASGKRRGRLGILVRRGRRLTRARRAIGSHRRARRVFTTGLLPAATHDAAINGVSDREALILRRTAAAACTPRARGRSLALVTIMNQAPTWRAETEVVLQYARQVWAASLLGSAKSGNGAFTLPQIAQKWRATDKEAIFSGSRRRDDGHAHGADGGDIGGQRRAPASHALQRQQLRRDGSGDAHDVEPRVGRRRRRNGDQVVHPREDRTPAHARDGQHQRPPGESSAARRRMERTWMSDGRRREWDQVRGPIGAAILSLHRIGWDMPAPFTLRDDRGEDIQLTKVTPAMLAVYLKEATLRTLERYVGSQVAIKDENFRGRRACVDHLRGQLAHDRRLTSEGRAVYLSALCGAVMTYHRAANSGYLVDDLCPKCGCRGDTLHHRIWGCMHPDVVEARNRVAPQWIRDEVARRAATQAFWTSGLLPHPGDTWPRPATEATPQADFEGPGRRPVDEQLGIPCLGDKIYVDGSCTQHVIAELRRAATAIVARDEATGATWSVRMAVPTPMPQSSQAAEHVALPMLQAYLPAAKGEWDVASDCATVVKACSEKGNRSIASSRLYGGLLKPVLADPEWRRKVHVRKVAAHVNADALEGAARDDAIGNDLADKQAKKARDLHPQPSPAQVQTLEADLRRARIVVRTIAATLATFDPMPRDRMKRRPVLKDGAQLRGDGGHLWVYRAGCWRCDICWILTIKADISPAVAHRRCQGPKESLAAEAITNRGHKLARAEADLSLLFCWDCGSFSARRAYGLGATCRGTPTPAGAQALARIRRGEQPWQSKRDAGRPRPRLGMAAAWSRGRAQFVTANGDGAADGRRHDDREHLAHGNQGEDSAEDTTPLHAQPRHSDDTFHVDDAGGTNYQMSTAYDADDDAAMRDGNSGPCHDEGHGQSDDMATLDAIGNEEDIFGHGGSLDQPHHAVHAPNEVDTGNDMSIECTAQHGIATDDRDASMSDVATICGAVQPVRPRIALDHHEQGYRRAEATCPGNRAVGAREGPGGPESSHMTAAVATSRSAVVTVAVVDEDDRATPPHPSTTSRMAHAIRGKVARGPPRDRVESRDSSMNMAKRRRYMQFPLDTPTSPEAGSGSNWHALSAEEGMGQPGDERRRDGTDSPVRRPAAARYGDVAAVPRGRETPESGESFSHVQGARESECPGMPSGIAARDDGTSMDPPRTSGATTRSYADRDHHTSPSAASATAADDRAGRSDEDRPPSRRRRLEDSAPHRLRDLLARVRGHQRPDQDAEARGLQQRGGLQRPAGRVITRGPEQPTGDAPAEQGQPSGRRLPLRGTGAHEGASGSPVRAHPSPSESHDRDQSNPHPAVANTFDLDSLGPSRAPLSPTSTATPAGRRRQRDADRDQRPVHIGGAPVPNPAAEPQQNTAAAECDLAGWAAPWMKPPWWLYPPPRAHGDAEDDDQRSEAKRPRRPRADCDDTEVADATRAAAGMPAVGYSSAAASSSLDARAAAARPATPTSTSIAATPGALMAERPAVALGGHGGQHAQIRGRGTTPGAGSPAAVQVAEIRGPDGGPGPRQQDGGGRASAAQKRLDLRNWKLRTSMAQHAERVENKRQRMQGDPTGPTAAERMAAVRRRVANRLEGQQVGTTGQGHERDAQPAGGNVGLQPGPPVIYAASSYTPEAGDRGDDGHGRPSNEDVKMHSLQLHGTGIHATACQARALAETTVAASDTGPRGLGSDQPGAAAATPAALAAAASRVAWHSVPSSPAEP